MASSSGWSNSSAPSSPTGWTISPRSAPRSSSTCPITPTSSAGHTYILSIIDNNTRWVECVALKNLSSKGIVDGLISTFTRTSIPQSVISDNASNLVSGLNKAIYNAFGIELKNSTPYHPQGNSIVERWTGTLKKMLHFIMKEGNGRQWHKKLDFMLWNYSETPHDILGVSPYQMVYGRVGLGPLNVIKNTWTKEAYNIGGSNKKAVKEYLDELKESLELGNKFAQQQCDKKQKQYINKYNEKTTEKDFQVGEEVLILMPSSTNSLLSTWIGPVTVSAKLSKNSYKIAKEDGSTRRLHANHLRKYIARINSIGILYEGDEDFGNVEACPTMEDSEVSIEDINNIDLSHLNEKRARQMRELLIKYKKSL